MWSSNRAISTFVHMTLSSTVIPCRSVSESKHAGFLPHLHLPALHICATPEQPPSTIHSNATKTCYSYIYIQIIYHLLPFALYQENLKHNILS